jgi:hypothetical protein
MTGHGAKFGRKKEQAVAALLVHRSVEEAAKAIGVDPKTLRKWQKIPEFSAAYRQARRDAFEQTVGRLQSAAATAGPVAAVGSRSNHARPTYVRREHTGGGESAMRLLPRDFGDEGYRDRGYPSAPSRPGASRGRGEEERAEVGF